MDRILFSGPHNCEQLGEERRHRENVADCLKTASDVYSYYPSQLSVGTLGPLSTFIAAVTERAQAPSGQSPIFYGPERGGRGGILMALGDLLSFYNQRPWGHMLK